MPYLVLCDFMLLAKFAGVLGVPADILFEQTEFHILAAKEEQLFVNDHLSFCFIFVFTLFTPLYNFFIKKYRTGLSDV